MPEAQWRCAPGRWASRLHAAVGAETPACRFCPTQEAGWTFEKTWPAPAAQPIRPQSHDSFFALQFTSEEKHSVVSAQHSARPTFVGCRQRLAFGMAVSITPQRHPECPRTEC